VGRYKDSLPIQVCKKMYLNTLCLKEWMVLNWVKKSEHGIPKQKQNNLFLLKVQTQIMSLLHSIDQFKVYQKDYLMLIN